MDAHCHLSDEAFDASREAVYQELIAHQVEGLVLAGTDPKDWRRQTELSPPSPLRIARVFGLHPWWVEQYNDKELEEALLELKQSLISIDGLGELGLDYFRAKTTEDRARQRAWFLKQLHLSRERPELPLILHMVRSHHEALPILRKERRRFRGLVHAFWANESTARAYIDLGFQLSIPPRILKEDPHQILKRIEPEHLVFETDTPYFGADGLMVRPVFIREFLRLVSQHRGEDLKLTCERQNHLLSELFPILNS